MKKALSLLLCALMLVAVLSGLAACTEPEDPGVQPTRPEGYYPNITLTMNNLYYVQYDALMEAKNWSLVSNPFMDVVKEELGIKFKTQIQVNDIGVYFEKLNAEILAGKFADLACLGDDWFGIPNLKTANQNGLLADLTAYVNGTSDKATPSEEALELWEQAGESIFYPGTFDGQIKTLPWISDARASAHTFIYIRADWLEAVGKQAPTNLDELTEVMRAFKNNIDGAYGLVIGAGLFEGSCSLFDMFGVIPNMWYETDDGTLAYGLTNAEPMKAALRVLRDWYAEGLINNSEDNDISVMGTLHYTSQEIMNGKAGVHFGSSSMGFVSNTLRKNKDARFVTVPLFAADGYELTIRTEHDAFMFYAVGADCKYPEAAMKIYNHYLELATDTSGKYNYLFENTKYENAAGEEVEDYPPCQFAPIRNNAATDIEKSKEFIEKLLAKDTEGMTDGELKNYNTYWEAVDSGEINYKNYWTVELYKEGGVYSQLYDMYENANFTRDIFFGVPTASMDSLLGEIAASPVLDAISIIKGEQPVEYWDTTVATWLEQGGQTVTDEVNAWWQSINA